MLNLSSWRDLATHCCRCAAILALALAVLPSLAARPQPIFSNSDGVAVNGFDVVAYFNEGAIRGLPAFEVEYRGAKWYFESKKNMAKFLFKPDKYVPVYGGYCAYGVSQGYLVKTDPDAWTVYQGKLYLNFDVITRSHWLKDRNQYIAKADKNWPRLIN